MSKTLYTFNWDCGRMGSVEGLFVECSEVVDAAIGLQVYFGEILGKHSEVFGKLDAGDLKALTTDSAVIGIIEEHVGDIGYNPIAYMHDEFNDRSDEYDSDSPETVFLDLCEKRL